MLKKNYNEDYCLVVQNHGGSFRLRKLDGSNDVVIGKVCGKLNMCKKKKGKKISKQNRISENSVVLVSNREFESKVVDIIKVFTYDEVKQLKKQKAIIMEEDEIVDTGIDMEESDATIDFDEI